MSAQKPEALRLADVLAARYPLSNDVEAAAAELRRLHAQAAELEAQLEAVVAGGVGPLMAPASIAPATYDPNMDWSEQTVEIAYQSWDYRATVQVQIGGNCMGHSIMESAVSSHADKLVEEQGEYPVLVLTNMAGETLETSFDDDFGDDVETWLADMCVGLRIIKQAEE